ncbi:MAG: type II secretion system protein N, partial [Burkholderiales bacterium]|nr:type II secretion system protein N [Burkholderiales bacterium]
SLSKAGLQVSNVNVDLSVDQLEPFLGNLSSMSLSGNVHVDASSLTLGKANLGTVNVKLEDVGSGISSVNPIGSYTLQINLANSSIDVNSSPDSVIGVTATGSMNSLTLNSTVQADKKEKLLQFMTMMGLPQADGSYKMKVF